eukprot:scaffold44503_cov42-Prasinocladus_malaysianus.AAC.1
MIDNRAWRLGDLCDREDLGRIVPATAVSTYGNVRAPRAGEAAGKESMVPYSLEPGRMSARSLASIESLATQQATLASCYYLEPAGLWKQQIHLLHYFLSAQATTSTNTRFSQAVPVPYRYA